MNQPDADASPHDTAGVVRPRRGLPGSRAAVGGLLVTVAILGTWFVAVDRGGDDRRPHVLAGADLPAGHRIGPEDLVVVDIDLPTEQAERTFADPDDLIDTVTLGPIGAGELIQPTSVGASSEEPGVQFSFAIEREWALAGGIEVGDRIDLYASNEGETARVLTNVVVQDLSAPDDRGPADTGRQVITVGGPDPDEIERIVPLIRGGTLTVVRVTDARPPNDPSNSTESGRRSEEAVDAEAEAGHDRPDERAGNGS